MISARKLDQTINLAAEELELRKLIIINFLNQVLMAEAPISTHHLARLTDLPKTHFRRLLQAFGFLYDIDDAERLRLRSNEKSTLESVVSKYALSTNELSEKLTKKVTQFAKLRPQPERQYDQFFAYPSTTIKRAIKLYAHGDLTNRRLVFLGDDDLTSTAVALTNQAAQITVFEIDPKIIATIQQIAEKNRLNIQIHQHDLRQPITDRKLLQHFDVVFTDPPYTPGGISLFLNRSIELLSPKLSSRIYLCYGNSERARERELEIQKIINQSGLLINTKLSNFNHYMGAESIGSVSSLYLCDWTPKTAATAAHHTNKIYTYE
jgi:predicted methyltransferase